MTGESYVGGLAGYNSGIITNSWASGTVTSSNASSTATATGGLVGYNIGIITNSHASSTVTGNNQAGGPGWVQRRGHQRILRHADQPARRTSTPADSSVITSASSSRTALPDPSQRPSDGGGLVGYNAGTIRGSNATGAVNVSGTYGGGLAGESTPHH